MIAETPANSCFPAQASLDPLEKDLFAYLFDLTRSIDLSPSVPELVYPLKIAPTAYWARIPFLSCGRLGLNPYNGYQLLALWGKISLT